MGKPGAGYAASPPCEHIARSEGTTGIETSKYREEKKANASPSVAASEEGSA